MPSYIDLGLPDIPDPQLDTATWQEMQKVFQAAKNLAMALNGGIYSSNVSGSKITVQDYCVVYRIATFDIVPGSVVELVNTMPNSPNWGHVYDSGQLIYSTAPTTNSVQLSSQSFPYPTAYTENYVSAGVSSPFILLGAVKYPAANLTPGTRYYVDLNNPGGITAAAGGRYVGQALAVDILYFDPQNY